MKNLYFSLYYIPHVIQCQDSFTSEEISQQSKRLEMIRLYVSCKIVLAASLPIQYKLTRRCNRNGITDNDFSLTSYRI